MWCSHLFYSTLFCSLKKNEFVLTYSSGYESEKHGFGKCIFRTKPNQIHTDMETRVVFTREEGKQRAVILVLKFLLFQQGPI